MTIISYLLPGTNYCFTEHWIDQTCMIEIRHGAREVVNEKASNRRLAMERAWDALRKWTNTELRVRHAAREQGAAEQNNKIEMRIDKGLDVLEIDYVDKDGKAQTLVISPSGILKQREVLQDKDAEIERLKALVSQAHRHPLLLRDSLMNCQIPLDQIDPWDCCPECGLVLPSEVLSGAAPHDCDPERVAAFQAWLTDLEDDTQWDYRR